MNIQEIEMFVGSMPSAAARILWLLFLTQKAYQAKEIEVVLGMSDKTVTKGLHYLERQNLVTNHGRTVGYHISDGVRQLPLPFQQIASATNASHPASLGDETSLPALLGEAVQTSHPALLGDDEDRKNYDLSYVAQREDRKNYDLEKLSTGQDRKNYDLEKLSTGEDRKNYDLDLSSCTSSTRTRSSRSSSSSSKTKLDQDQSLLLTKESADRKNYDLGQIRHWLLKADVGPNSPKMRQLLGMNLTLSYVKAHVLEFLYQNQKESESYPTGQLIYRVQNGWASPTMRCTECLKPLKAKYQAYECQCQYEDETAVSSTLLRQPEGQEKLVMSYIRQQIKERFGATTLHWFREIVYLELERPTFVVPTQEVQQRISQLSPLVQFLHRVLEMVLGHSCPQPNFVIGAKYERSPIKQ